ncbi:MAG: RagB/SusD family nutrient uptake outer membrane protein, partial [Paludibacteraceae bacterium]|nr:RagB/SusD family nutrient uptake outer membrane protein [Paludibacteraceae bacterium]
EYTLYYVNYDGEKIYAQVFDKFPVHYFTYPEYFVTKFSYQDGKPFLSSPVVLRWAEIVLNRAEAYAKLGQNDLALADVNAIRNRAGIPAEGMFSAGNMHGYTSVLDVVLDERRMELAFEGHRRNDVYRNKRTMNRKYAGTQPWEEIPYTADKIQYPIPFNEHSVSGIPQNPGY